MASFTLPATGSGVYQFDPVDPNGNVVTLTEVEKAAVDRPDLLTLKTVSGTQFSVTGKGKQGTANVTIVGKNESGQPISSVFQFTFTAPAPPPQAVGFRGTQIA